MFPPLENLKFWAGAGLVALALALSSSHLLDGPSEIEAAQATEASPESFTLKTLETTDEAGSR